MIDPRILQCPRCKTQPPRWPNRGGRTPLCFACYRATQRYKGQQRRMRGRIADDLSPTEIERRFQFALKQIRRRAWTSAIDL